MKYWKQLYEQETEISFALKRDLKFCVVIYKDNKNIEFTDINPNKEGYAEIEEINIPFAPLKEICDFAEEYFVGEGK